MQMSRFWFFAHDALRTVSDTACPIPLKLLDFEGSTIISEQFEQVKHQFVWPDMLLKRLINKSNGLRKRLLKYNFELFRGLFFWIEVHVVLKEVHVFSGTQGNHLHAQSFKSRCDFKFYCLKKIICFYSHGHDFTVTNAFFRYFQWLLIYCKQRGLSTRGVRYKMMTCIEMDMFCFHHHHLYLITESHS